MTPIYKFFACLALISLFFTCVNAQEISTAAQNNIVIEIETKASLVPDSFYLLYKESDGFIFSDYNKQLFQQTKNGLRCSFPSSGPLVISAKSHIPLIALDECLLLPGDSVHIRESKNTLVFTGKGCQLFEMMCKFNMAINKKELDSLRSTKPRLVSDSLNDFFSYRKLYKSYYNSQMSFLEKYKQKLPLLTYQYSKNYYADQAVYYIGAKFLSILFSKSKFRLSNANIISIFDSTMVEFKPDIDWVNKTGLTPQIMGLEQYIILKEYRSREFKNYKNKLDRGVCRYYSAKDTYTGFAQRKMLLKILSFWVSGTHTELRNNSAVNDFLSLDGYPEYKSYYEKILNRISKAAVSVKKEYVSQADGPYVLYKGTNITVKSIGVNGSLPYLKEDTIEIPVKTNISLRVNTDTLGNSFEVAIKNKLSVEPAEFPKPQKVLVISDIEGNFNSFKALLQSNNVINENYDWTFQNGHLVLVGDFFDRGNQVTEGLWLIYSLEEKAKIGGGYVHFILGNHEIMNMNGDIRYVQQKYKDNAELIGEDYSAGLYGRDSELGRWLRTKNVIEKIGDILYTHGGVSEELNNLNLSVSEINNIARPFYANGVLSRENKTLNVIMGANASPYWYRGYYKNVAIKESQIDSTLAIYAVKKVVTGHTIIGAGERITSHFSGKVINVDTHHAKGHSEALLIENDMYYRVSQDGKKVSLFDQITKLVRYNELD